LLNKTFTVR